MAEVNTPQLILLSLWLLFFAVIVGGLMGTAINYQVLQKADLNYTVIPTGVGSVNYGNQTFSLPPPPVCNIQKSVFGIDGFIGCVFDIFTYFINYAITFINFAITFGGIASIVMFIFIAVIIIELIGVAKGWI